MKSRFTLIELLVVIAIIAILAAMLLPALSAARERARAANCMSQLKQMGLATTMYMDQNEGFTPPGRWAPGNGEWWFTLSEYIPSQQQEVKKSHQFRCPSISEQPDNVTGSIWASYVPNGNFFEANKMGLNTSVIGQPTKSAMFIESTWENEPGYITGQAKTPMLNFSMHSRILVGNANAIVAFPHGKNQNTVFFDGHVETKNASSTPKQEIYNNGNSLYIIPFLYPLPAQQDFLQIAQ
jgi:prepilin-type N-terminal cleavage/methylation domain-containing protein/prepilin-type processing-associated H-X9-DG protein